MKKLLCVTLVTILALVFAGCDNAYGITTTPPTEPTRPVETTPVQTTPAPTTPAQTTPAPTTPPTTPTPTEPTTAEPVDELEIFSTTFDLAMQNMGVFLVRGEKIYSLNYCDKVNNPSVEYPIRNIKTTYGKGADFYVYDTRPDYCRGISIGELPVPVLEEGDKIIYFGGEMGDVELSPIEPIGYSCFSVAQFTLFMNEHGEVTNLEKVKEWELRDSNGQLAEDPYTLVKDEEYTLSWYVGTQYNETKFVADCFVFRYAYYNDECFFVTGELTKDGYAVFDLSSAPSGTYRISVNGFPYGNGLIQIP